MDPALPAPLRAMDARSLTIAERCLAFPLARLRQQLSQITRDARPRSLSNLGAERQPVRAEPFQEVGIPSELTLFTVDLCATVFALSLEHEAGVAKIKTGKRDDSSSLIEGRMDVARTEAAADMLINGPAGMFLLLCAAVNPVQFLEMAAVAPKLKVKQRVQTLALSIRVSLSPEWPVNCGVL